MPTFAGKRIGFCMHALFALVPRLTTLLLTLGLVFGGVLTASAAETGPCNLMGHEGHLHPIALIHHDASEAIPPDHEPGHGNTVAMGHNTVAMGHEGCVSAQSGESSPVFHASNADGFAKPAWFAAAPDPDAFPRRAGELHRPPNT
ncbi:hypothetical protein LVO79_07295 [Roseivivax marinus]|uniref:hypothetical protein n=1 Tax=Roseivivax marinus TaxID=1379903 RepID=UPI001F03DD0C|nr:hypothetical protein [Roseivivax marinus]UMA66241.1 hypothetical protein LVO79_07295 [Roseivivax marinus]